MKTYTNTIRTLKGACKGERMQVKAFKTSEDMHKFLNTGDNAHKWRETIDQTETHPGAWGACNEKTLKPGKYAWAGGQWHNVKSLDASVLAHI
jgi:hypothetical protein